MTKLTILNKDGKKYVKIGKKKIHVPLEITNKYELIRWIVEFLTKKRKRRRGKPKSKINPTTGKITSETLEDKKFKDRLKLEELEQKKRDKFIEEQQKPPPPPPQNKPKRHKRGPRKSKVQATATATKSTVSTPSTFLSNLLYGKHDRPENVFRNLAHLTQKPPTPTPSAATPGRSSSSIPPPISIPTSSPQTEQSRRHVEASSAATAQSMGQKPKTPPKQEPKPSEPVEEELPDIEEEDEPQQQQAAAAGEKKPGELNYRKYYPSKTFLQESKLFSAQNIRDMASELMLDLDPSKKTTPLMLSDFLSKASSARVRPEIMYTKLNEYVPPGKKIDGSKHIAQFDKDYSVQKAKGKINHTNAGLSDGDIDSVMKKFPHYLGTIAHNEIHRLHIKPRSQGGFIINTDPISKPGRHWQAIYFDARPNGSNEIDFYDSFGDPVDKSILRDLKDVANKLDAKTYLKFKENRIKQQSDASSNCGYFCMKFLIDRFNGKPFKDASGYSDVLHGEGDIERFKSKFPPFELLSSFGEAQQGGETLGLGPFNPIIQKHADEVITSMNVSRTPLSAGVNALIKIVTLGQSESGKKKLGYDNLFHLALNIKTDKGSEFSIEKTVSPHIGKYVTTGESMPVNISGKTITVKELIDNTINQVGEHRFRTYDAVNLNCQVFVEDILRSNNLLTATLHSFIYQDVNSVFKNAPWFQKIARTVTDLGGFINRAIYGNGKAGRVQSVLFDKKIWSPLKAAEWLLDHSFISNKIDVTDKYLHFRQFSPNSNSRHAIKKTNNGISFILEW